MKRILVAVFSIMILLGFTTTTDALAKEGSKIEIVVDGKTISLEKANVKVNGKSVEADVPSVLYKGNTLVPARIVAEQLGAKVDWDGKTNSAIIKTADKEIIIRKDGTKAMINGKEKNMPEGAMVKLMATNPKENSRTMVPFRFIAEELGAKVEWDNKTRTALITSKKGNTEVPVKPVEPVKPVKPEVKLNKIKLITTKERSGTKIPQIHIEAENEISYKDVLTKNELVIEIKDAMLEGKLELNEKNDIFTKIKAEKLNDKDIKITISLKPSISINHEIVKDKNTVKVNFINNLVGIERRNVDGKDAIVIKNANAYIASSFTLSDPERLVVDIRNTNLNNVGSQISTDIIKELRLGQYTGKEYDPTEKVARIVLDISENYRDPKYVTEERGNDLIIFVEGTKKAPVITPQAPPVVKPPTGSVVIPPITPPTSGQRTIVIDAGHGGRDGGAAANGIREKDVALKVSLKTRDKLEALGYKVLMSRTTDIYPSLSARYKLANDNKADAFVSVHFNAAGASSATGIETLYSNKNSKNKAFSQSIQNELISNTKARNRGLKPRNDLSVLNGTKGISTLVELGFITNPTDAKEIKTDSYLEKCADAIVNGIHKFFS